MIGLPSRLSEKVSRLSLAARCAVLNGCLLIALAVGLLVAGLDGRPAVSTAVLIAALICGLSANAALAVSSLGQTAAGGLVGVLGGMLVGMIPPLAFALVLHRRGGPLADAGVLLWILAFYLTTLVVKTGLIAPQATSAACKSSASRISSGEAGA